MSPRQGCAGWLKPGCAKDMTAAYTVNAGRDCDFKLMSGDCEWRELLTSLAKAKVQASFEQVLVTEVNDKSCSACSRPEEEELELGAQMQSAWGHPASPSSPASTHQLLLSASFLLYKCAMLTMLNMSLQALQEKQQLSYGTRYCLP